MKFFRALSRFFYLILSIMVGIGKIIWSNLMYGKDMHRTLRIRRKWAHHLLPALGIQLEVSGTPTNFPCIFMSNHRSYLDPFILVHDVDGLGVSKAEVSKWPIIGYGTKVTGVLFLERESSNSRQVTLTRIAQKVEEGFSVFLFPEGTTGVEDHTLDFRPGGFKLAASNNIPIVPVAIEYSSKDDYWVGDDEFVTHFFRRFSEKNIFVSVRYGEAIQSSDAVEMIAVCKSWIDAQLPQMQESLKRRVDN
jgi:1-acyl-sn-glycerol-3-phosphate acyltransferase